ncbi:hypothetical protein ACLKA7_001902, partial [Drosophila subpalustris]
MDGYTSDASSLTRDLRKLWQAGDLEVTSDIASDDEDANVTASAALLLRLAGGGADIALIQEPWMVCGKVSGLGSADYNANNINWAIKSFKPFKSAGPDGIFNTRIPEPWTYSKVDFIPKAGKASHITHKDYISLTSFLLKTFERILSLHLSASIPSGLISNSQHAYRKGRSTETALHSVITTIEKSLSLKEFTLIAFLDIEGAFNNVFPQAITEALTDLGIESRLVGLINQLLTSRAVTSTLGSSTLT